VKDFDFFLKECHSREPYRNTATKSITPCLMLTALAAIQKIEGRYEKGFTHLQNIDDPGNYRFTHHTINNDSIIDP